MRVLVIEDDADVSLLLGEYIRLCGGEYERAACGAAALGQIQAVRPDVILLDLMLADAHGFGICERLKADPVTAAIPVVIVTADGHAATRARGLSAGAADYLVKPFDPRRLLQALERLGRPSAVA